MIDPETSKKINKISKSAQLKEYGMILGLIIFIQIFLFSFGEITIRTIFSGVAKLADVMSSVLVLETNNYRAVNIKNNLTESALLTKAAQMKADDMALKGYFSHVGPQGEVPWSWFKAVGYKYDYAGENLAVDYTESADVTRGWINSATHKANILNPNFTEIGVGVAKGIFEGHETTFVVQFFGAPATYLNFIPENGILSVKNNLAITINTNSSSSEVLKKVETSIPVVSRPIISVDPETAVAIHSDLPVGEVLGVEAENTEPDDYSKTTYAAMLIFAGVIFFILYFILQFISYTKQEKLKL